MAWSRQGSWGAPQGGKGGAGAWGAPQRPTPQAAKTPTQAPKAAAAKPGSPSGTTLKVTTMMKKDVTNTTLCGTYVENGMNHTKKCYKKQEKIPGHEGVNVFLYYWDSRDGADFSGWWFGDQLGGTQVWAKANAHTPTPPKAGWKVPWDSPTVQAGALMVEPVTGGAAPTASTATPSAYPTASPATKVAPGVPAALRVKKAQDAVTGQEKIVENVVATAKKILANETAQPQALKVQQESLTKQQTKLQELTKQVQDDITELRKQGPSTNASITELSKISPKIRTMATSVTGELNKIKALTAKAEGEKKKKEAEATEKLQAAKDQKEWAAAKPKVLASLKAVQDAVEKIEAQATPIVESPPDSEADLNKQLTSIEQSAAEALKKLDLARTDLTTKLAAARKYAPETRKDAMPELTKSQTSLGECQRKLNPFKEFKKEFKGRVEARKALAEISEKFKAAEVEIEKASNMVTGVDAGQMSEEEVADAEATLKTTNAALNAAQALINQKTKGASAAVTTELNSMRATYQSMKKKLDPVSNKLKGQRDGLAVQGALASARDKTEKLDDLLKNCQDAEMPFLKGIEVLPKEESDQALGASDKAAGELDRAAAGAKGFIKQQLGKAKGYQKELSQSVTDQLTPLLTKVEQMETKLNNFKKETSERKMNALLAVAVEAATEAEKKVNQVEAAAKPLTADGLEEKPAAEITAIMEKADALEKEAGAACGKARQVVNTKQSEARRGGATVQLEKINARLKAAADKLGKVKAAIASGSKTIKIQGILEEQGEKLKSAEAEIEKAETSTLTGAGLSTEVVKEMDTAMTSANKTLRGIPGLVKPHIGGTTGKTKDKLQKLLDGADAGIKKLDKLKADTKKEREDVLSQSFIKDGEGKTTAAEDAIEKTNDAELPYLKGIEVLPLQESLATVAACEAASTAAQESISAARNWIAAKTIEAKQFATPKPIQDAFAKLTERINSAAKKLSEFKRDTEGRKKTSQIQEAGALVDEAEVLVKAVVAASQPFTVEGADKMGETDAAGPLKAFLEAEKAAKDKMGKARSFTQDRQKGATPANADTLKKLAERITNASQDMSKSRKAIGAHEQRFVATVVVVDVKEKLKELEPLVKKATEFCAPLLEKGGSTYLVTSSLKILAKGLAAYAKDKKLDVAGLFKEAGSGKVKEAAFVKYLGGLAQATGREELDFTVDRQKAIFAAMAKGGAVSETEFAAIFEEKCTCKKAVSLTDGSSVADSKTVGKLEPGNELTLLGVPKEEEGGMLRSQCKALDDKIGWVTVSGNSGSRFVAPAAADAFAAFCKEMDQAINEGQSAVGKISNFVSGKGKEGGPAAGGTPLADARAEIKKLSSQVSDTLKSLEDLKKKVQQSKLDFKKTEQDEANAHILKKQKKEAAVITAPAEPKVQAAVVAAQAVEDAGKEFVDLDKDATLSFAKPATITATVEKLAAACHEACEEAKKVLKEQQQVATKTTPPTPSSIAAKKELHTMTGQVHNSISKSKKTVDAIKGKCNTIVNNYYDKAAVALRKQIAASKSSAEKLFKDLAGSASKIPEDALTKKLQSLDGLGLQPEHAKLLCKRIEPAGVSLRRFLSYVQLYYTALKDIALTDIFKVSTCKTIRKAEKDEVLEVLEGPLDDEEIGLTRVRAKSLLDGQEGWVTVKGNQGTPFLTAVDKPFFYCFKAVPLVSDFKSTDAKEVRSIKEHEVLELLQGPQREEFPASTRARVKTSKDSVTGWVTLRDKFSVVYAEANKKLYTCKTSVAMTDGEDIKACKVLRKLAVDEMFEASGDCVEDKDAGVTRVAGKALKDGKEGWITTKGNAGTVYAEATNKFYSVNKEVALEKRFASGAEAIRTLEAGETFQVLEGPKEEKVQPDSRIKVRCISDDKVGWTSKGCTKKWSGTYKCLDKAAVTETAAVAEDAKVLRELQKGDTVKHVEGPKQEGKAIRMKVTIGKDVGWVSLVNDDGKKLFDCP